MECKTCARRKRGYLASITEANGREEHVDWCRGQNQTLQSLHDILELCPSRCMGDILRWVAMGGDERGEWTTAQQW